MASKRIVFPTLDNSGLYSKRGGHFGRAPFYTIVTIDSRGEILDVEGIANPGHGSGGCTSVVALIQGLGASVLVVSGIGASPWERFCKIGIEVYVDAGSATVAHSLEAYRQGSIRLLVSSDLCGHH